EIALAFLLAQPTAEGDGVEPRDADHRVIVRLLEAGVPPVDLRVRPPRPLRRAECGALPALLRLGLEAAGVVDERPELTNGHLVHPHVEQAGESHLVRILVIAAPGLLDRR